MLLRDVESSLMDQRGNLPTSSGRGFPRISDRVFLIIEIAVLLLALAAGWKERSGMPLVPISDPDTWGYLNPAMSWLSGLGFQQTDGRDWLYPAMLALFLKTTGSFAGIALWQKLLGIGSGLFMAATWRCWVSFLPVHGWLRLLASLGGFVPIFIQLTNRQNIFFEMSIRPEAVLSCFVYAQLACLMGYYQYRWRAPRDLPSLLFGAAAIVLAYACFLLKPSWLFAFGATAAPVFVGIFGRALSLKTRLLAPALGVVSSVALLWLPAAVFLIRDSSAITLLPDALFAVHARLIDKAFDAKLAALPDSDPERAKLQALSTVLKTELHAAATQRSYEKLGFNPDYLMHSAILTEAIYAYAGKDDRKFAAFCFDSYKAALSHDPWAVVQKILIQFTHFLFPEPQTFFKDRIEYANAYHDAAAVLAPDLADRFQTNLKEMYRRYKMDLDGQSGAEFNFDMKPKLRSFRRTASWLALPVEILFVLTFVAALAWAPLRDLRLGGWAAFSLFSAPLGNALSVCVVHALDITRYRLTYGGFLLFALVAMTLYALLVIVCSVTHAMRRRSASQVSLPN